MVSIRTSLQVWIAVPWCYISVNRINAWWCVTAFQSVRATCCDCQWIIPSVPFHGQKQWKCWWQCWAGNTRLLHPVGGRTSYLRGQNHPCTLGWVGCVCKEYSSHPLTFPSPFQGRSSALSFPHSPTLCHCYLHKLLQPSECSLTLEAGGAQLMVSAGALHSQDTILKKNRWNLHKHWCAQKSTTCSSSINHQLQEQKYWRGLIAWPCPPQMGFADSIFLFLVVANLWKATSSTVKSFIMAYSG